MIQFGEPNEQGNLVAKNLLTHKDKGLDQLKIVLHMLNESEKLDEKRRSSMPLDYTRQLNTGS